MPGRAQMTLKTLRAAVISKLLLFILILMMVTVFGVLLIEPRSTVEESGRLERSAPNG